MFLLEDATKHRVLFLFVAVLVMAIAVTAVPGAAGQSATTQPAPHTVVTFGWGPAGGTISSKQHAPFSAVLVEQMAQTLNDGTNIAHENQEVAMRDGMGRIYRARKIKRPGREAEFLMFYTITDPVRHVQYRCIPFRKTCSQMEYRFPPVMHRFPGKNKDVTVEDLGTSNISGLEVEGKRLTRVIPEGTTGNDRAFTTTEELWSSKELDVDVQVKRNDPRMGTRTTTMTEVSLGEPDPSLFQIPDGYKVEKRKRPTGALAPLPSGGETGFPPSIAPPNH